MLLLSLLKVHSLLTSIFITECWPPLPGHDIAECFRLLAGRCPQQVGLASQPFWSSCRESHPLQSLPVELRVEECKGQTPDLSLKCFHFPISRFILGWGLPVLTPGVKDLVPASNLFYFIFEPLFSCSSFPGNNLSSLCSSPALCSAAVAMVPLCRMRSW